VIGHGRLVGAPVALLMRHNLANVTVVDRPMKNLAEITQEANIIISEIKSPGLVTRSMVKQGAVLIDAGTTESGGMLVGDIDKECEDIASYSTPVPGGVGPITVAVLMKNIALLAKQAHTNTEDHVEF
jgi:5,10-methylene-tetrahydrofolate dehydrogenase/methenyl tetrahydrofolate cyclohydrolase